MKNFETLQSTIWKVVDATRKVHAHGSLQLPEFEKFIKTIQAINAIPRNVRSFQGYHYDEWLIPLAFKDLVYPNSVTLEQKDTDRDVLVRMEAPDEIMDLSEFNLFASKFYGIYKKAAETVTLSSLKVNATIGSVAQRGVMESMPGEFYLPNTAAPAMPLNLSFLGYEDFVYVNKMENVVERLFLSILSTL